MKAGLMPVLSEKDGAAVRVLRFQSVAQPAAPLADARERIAGLSDAYDVRTDHGRNQQTPHGATVITVPP